MNNQTLVIYDFKILYEVLNETKNYLNFNLISVDKNQISHSDIKNLDEYLIISNKKINGFVNQMIINDFPIQLPKLVENININFLKKNIINKLK